MLDILSNMSATERGEFQVDPELETALDLASYNGTGTALCRHMMAKHWSIATFRLASANAMRLYQDVKVSFSDKIATFGNNNAPSHLCNALRVFQCNALQSTQ